MKKIIPCAGVKRTKTDTDMTHLKKKSIDEAIRNIIRKKDVYETDIHKIYNLIVGQINKKLQ